VFENMLEENRVEGRAWNEDVVECPFNHVKPTRPRQLDCFGIGFEAEDARIPCLTNELQEFTGRAADLEDPAWGSEVRPEPPDLQSERKTPCPGSGSPASMWIVPARVEASFCAGSRLRCQVAEPAASASDELYGRGKGPVAKIVQPTERLGVVSSAQPARDGFE